MSAVLRFPASAQSTELWIDNISRAQHALDLVITMCHMADELGDTLEETSGIAVVLENARIELDEVRQAMLEQFDMSAPDLPDGVDVPPMPRDSAETTQ